MRVRICACLLMAMTASFVAWADEPPVIEHQPVPCTVPSSPMTICSGASDDVRVEKVRLFFRPANEKYYSYVEMTFGGINYCATLPAPKPDRIKAIEYYIQAIDSEFQAQRTSTFRLAVDPANICEFPPLETDPERAKAITVYATQKQQGKKLHSDFIASGVTFVPVAN
ncbi:MAG: hypothetical protein MUF51_07590 [Vicinamibacteria bacterium]|nr:hypothetical protein [Vicinamibacteria bacterium]